MVLVGRFQERFLDAIAHAKEAVKPSKSLPQVEVGSSQPMPPSPKCVRPYSSMMCNRCPRSLNTHRRHLTPLPSLRFVLLPNPHRAVPLSNQSTAQDCRPGVVAFKLSAFFEQPVESSPVSPLDNCPSAYIC